MDSATDDRFVVYIRFDPGHPDRPDTGEKFVGACSSYKEARQLRREYQRAAQECVIRYVGPAGGGD